MRKAVIILLSLASLILLSGCYKDRNELFDIPIISGTYSYIGEDEIVFLDKTITNFSISFTDSGATTNELDGYDKNIFGDYSFNDIKLYNILIEIEFDNNKYDCDVDFLGVANPQRPNAYRLSVTIPGFSEQKENFIVIIDFDIYDLNSKGLSKIYVQLVDEINSGTEKKDASFYIDNIANNFE
jgi:hypothetical protein